MISTGKKYCKLIFATIFMMVCSTSLFAQGAGDVLRYSLQYPGHDPISVVMPGVSDATGFGVYQENPASVALFDDSFFSFSLSDRYVNEEGQYLGNTSEFDDNQVSIGDLGFVYNVPTARGKLTIGGGYSQSHDFNRAVSVSGRNNQNSMTDSYPITVDDGLFFAAFDAFAIDYNTPDSTFAETASIFRVDSPYQGINQNSETTERGVIGEYSAFIATEIQKNLILGASVGIISGSYEYRRDFLETDSQNDYETQFVDESGNVFGIDNILREQSIDETFTGFSLRVGSVYQITPNVQIGASYQFKNTLTIDTQFNNIITNTLDDGSSFQEEGPGEFQYKITRPSRLNLGFTAKDLAGVTISAAAERIAYSEGRIEFEDIEDDMAENFENNIVESSLEDVFNLRFGLEYAINPKFAPRIGYAYYPSPTKNIEADRQFYSAGFTAQVSESVQFNLGAQLGIWDDENTLYNVPDEPQFGDDPVARENVTHWNIMGGLVLNF